MAAGRPRGMRVGLPCIAQFVIVIAVVLLRPWGLLGKKEREA